MIVYRCRNEHCRHEVRPWGDFYTHVGEKSPKCPVVVWAADAVEVKEREERCGYCGAAQPSRVGAR
jgi:hypothetical protein